MLEKTKKISKAQQRAEAIEKCKDKTGRVRPQIVIEVARDPKSILHKEFEWDVKKGHQIYLMDRARELIREAKFYIRYADVQLAVPQYISDKYDKNASYVETFTIKKKSVRAKETMMDEVRRIGGAAERSRGLSAQFDLGLDTYFEVILSTVAELENELT